MNRHERLAAAIESGDVPLVTAVLERHPDLLNSPEWTPPPLHCAVLWNQAAIVSALLDLGADLEFRDPDRETTPLRYAILFARLEIVRLLIARGADTGPLTAEGTSALGLAIEAMNGAFEEYDDLPPRSEYAEIVELLRESTPG